MPDTLLGAGTCISKLWNFCNLSNQTAISAIRLQSSCIAVWLCRLQFDCGDCSLIVKIAVKLWRLQSFYADCCLILEIAVWLWRLPSGMSGMRENSEWKANALNFFKPVLSTNQRPQFLALNQWEASISGPPILTQFINQTAISAIRQPSQQSDCNLSNQTAISAIKIKHLATCLTPCLGPWHV